MDRGAARGRRTSQGGKPAFPAFDIESADLPAAIEAAAATSGGFPYDKKLKRKPYERELRALQIEFLKLQAWVKDKGERLVIVFEGRDGAGKGGAIKRLTQHSNPRQVRVVALAKPSDVESGQWYFQRYIAQLPTRGEIVLFDRSWYNRAGVERVMGFAGADATRAFLQETPLFEEMLTRDGIRLVKFFLTIGREMQMKRLHARYHDPLKRWKLSPIDFEAIARWDAYSTAIEEMIASTSTKAAPWTIVRANEKLRTRLEIIRHVLSITPYEGKDADAVGAVDRKIVLDAKAFLARGGES